MDREELLEIIENGDLTHQMVVDMFDEFVKDPCKECRHLPIKGINYLSICGDCKHFFSDNFEKKS